jgi:hypothetical protein
MPVRERDPQTGETRLFKAASVFDRQQVAALDGVDQTPLEPPCEAACHDDRAEYEVNRARLEAQCRHVATLSVSWCRVNVARAGTSRSRVLAIFEHSAGRSPPG